MKNLIFESLELLSLTERKARKVEFHPLLTVITGENGVGKSSLIKHIYWTLGAAPAVIHPKWKKVAVKGLLTFTIDGVRYKALRNKDRVAIFDEGDRLLLSTNSFTSELGPFLADLLDFKLVLSNRKGEPEQPPPAYAFLPFYVDQDAGWSKPLNSFDRLTQYSNFKTSVVEFHSGIRPNRYYELTAKKKQLDLHTKELGQDRTIVQNAISRLRLEPGFSGVELSLEDHENAIQDLLVKVKSIRELRQTRAAELADIVDRRVLIDEQIAIVEASIAELSEDAQWATDDNRDKIPCPTCGTMHLNDFTNRFAILTDREECFTFLSDAQQKKRGLAKSVEEIQRQIRSADETIAEIQALLDERRGDVTLRELIENEGRRTAAALLRSQIDDLETQIGKIVSEISDIDTDIREIDNPSTRQTVEKYYAGFMSQYMKALNVLDADNDAVTKISGRIVETGSEQPRLLLAYILALDVTIRKFSTAFAAPLVIDSPVQQEQDMTNAPAIIKLVTSARPHSGQTIIGTISLHGNAIDASMLREFTEKKSILSSGEYEAVYARLSPLIERM
ncbi:AAA family ATPase [Sinorhizobium medicae]|nr:AAA family ATPase [Sinorhizobium medicae]MDX0417502.1 AAA family ATPase [Sinorhizobium medicae]MDX1031866.1 AAA family ATPase [Sinorhizobium medicae]MDX1191909.1 AAA family ATPase [Sinorhizobium medicae]MDX1234335.1 AAA family ATPase [Sinorhizobium medicae]